MLFSVPSFRLFNPSHADACAENNTARLQSDVILNTDLSPGGYEVTRMTKTCHRSAGLSMFATKAGLAQRLCSMSIPAESSPQLVENLVARTNAPVVLSGPRIRCRSNQA